MYQLQFLAAASVRGAGAGEHILYGAKHQRERRAELVTDIAEECGLDAVDFGKRFGASTFFFIGAGIRDCRGHLAGDEIEKAAIAIVELKVRADAEDQQPCELVRDVRGDRAHGRGTRWVRPRLGRHVR